MCQVPELIDTLFIVLRKKPLIFLHWYHHITVLLFCWHAFATLTARYERPLHCSIACLLLCEDADHWCVCRISPSILRSGIYFVAMNYTVHAIMYFYYFLTALGYRPRWALAVTVFQLSQVRASSLSIEPS